MNTLARRIVLLLSVTTAPVCAFNHPEIEWRSVTTDHFIINYYDRTEPVLYAAWRIAEEAYAELSAVYEYDNERKIALSLADYDDYSNGWADWLSGAIMIWVPDARFELRGNTTWLRNVICHELAHIMSLYQRKKLQTLDWTLSLSYTSPSANVWLQEPFARMTLLPDWLSEGVAQLGSEHMGGDCWDSRRDMVLRSAVTSGEQLTLAEMSHFTHDGLGSELVYNQGYSLARYIKDRIGDDAFHQMFVSAGTMRFKFAEYFKLKTGYSLEQMYHGWLDSVHTAARELVPRDPTPMVPVWRKGFLSYLPRVSPDGQYWGWLTNHRDDGYRTDLVIARFGSSRPVTRIEYAHTSWDFSHDSRSVYYIKSRRTNGHGSSFNDLYWRRIGAPIERRITSGARIYDIAVSPDGASLAATRYSDGAFGLYRYSIGDGSWVALVSGEAGSPFQGPSFNPTDKSQLVVTRIVAGNADLYLIDTADRTMTRLTTSAAQEEFPHWGRDGRVYFSADYEGIYNIYSIAPDGADLVRHSRVAGGAFAPHLTPNGSILCLDYTRFGYGVATCKPERSPVTPSDSMACAFEPLPVPRGHVTVQGAPYAAKMLRSAVELETFVDVYWDDTLFSGERYRLGLAGMALHLFRNDALMKKYLYMGMYLGLTGGAYYLNDTTESDTAGDTSQTTVPIHTRRGLKADYESVRRDRRRGPSSLIGAGRPEYSAAFSPARQFPFGSGEASESSDSSDSDVYWAIPSLFLEPVFYYENARLAPTIGFTGMGAISLGMGGMMPEFIMLEPFAYLHLMRDVYWGITPYGEIYPTSGFSYYLAASAWLQWLRYGYYEEDWYYTMRSITNVSVQFGPQLFPTEDDGALGAMASGVSVTHGFPWGRSSSLVVDAFGGITNAADPFVTPALGDSGVSDLYVEGSLGLRAVMPLAKNINHGYSLYADALYWSVFYEGSIIANRGFINEAGRDDVRTLLVKRRASTDAAVEHRVGGDITLGLYKNFLFFRTLSVAGAYELLEDKLFFDVNLTF